MNPGYFHSSLSKMEKANKQKQLWKAKLGFFSPGTPSDAQYLGIVIYHIVTDSLFYIKMDRNLVILVTGSVNKAIHILHTHTECDTMNLIEIHTDDTTRKSRSKPGIVASQMSLRRKAIENKQCWEIIVYYWALLQDQSNDEHDINPLILGAQDEKSTHQHY